MKEEIDNRDEGYEDKGDKQYDKDKDEGDNGNLVYGWDKETPPVRPPAHWVDFEYPPSWRWRKRFSNASDISSKKSTI